MSLPGGWSCILYQATFVKWVLPGRDIAISCTTEKKFEKIFFTYLFDVFSSLTLKKWICVVRQNRKKKGKVLDCVCGCNRHPGIRTRQFRLNSLIHNHYENAKYPHDIASADGTNPTLFIADKWILSRICQLSASTSVHTVVSHYILTKQD